MPAFTSVNPVNVNKATQKAHYDAVFNNTLHILNDATTFTGVKTFSDGVVIATTKRLYLDGGGDTYITESAANRLDAYVGGSIWLRVEPTYVYVPSGDLMIASTKKFYLDAGSDTYISEIGANDIGVYTAGAIAFRVTSTYVESYKDLRLQPAGKLYLDGGGNTYIHEVSADTLEMYVGGTQVALYTTSGIDARVAYRLAGWNIAQYVSGNNFRFGGLSAAQYQGVEFYANGSEVARFDTAGLGVGTAPAFKMHVLGVVNNGAVAAFQNGHATAPNGIYMSFYGGVINNSTQYFIYGEDAGGQRFKMAADGGLHNYQANNVNLSDLGAKFGTYEKPTKGGALSRIRRIEFYMDKHLDSERAKPDLMWYAQQLMTVDSDFVTTWQEEDKKAGKPKLLGTRDHQVFMTTTLAVQELSQLFDERDITIENLQKRVKTLEDRLNAA